MSTEEIIAAIKSKNREEDTFAYRAAFILMLSRRGLPGSEIGRIMDMSTRHANRCIHVICDYLSVEDSSVMKAYYEVGRHTISVLTENVAEREGSGNKPSLICKYVAIDGVNFES